MRVNASAVLRSWTLLAAFGGSYAPDIIHVHVVLSTTNVHVHVALSTTNVHVHVVLSTINVPYS